MNSDIKKRIVLTASADLSDVPDAARDTYIYWENFGKTSGLPRSSDIDVLSLPKDWLPYLALVDVTVDPLDLRYRLVGTSLVAWMGHDPTGRPVAEGTAFEDVEIVLANYRMVIENQRPVLVLRGRYLPDLASGLQGLWLLFCPFAGDDGQINRIMVHCRFSGGGSLFHSA